MRVRYDDETDKMSPLHFAPGEPLDELAEEYGLTPDEMKDAICFERAA